jgi:general secretion pathway protein L
MQSGGSALQSLGGGLATFLAWWRDELVGLVPDRVRAAFGQAKSDVVLAQVDDGFVVLDGAAQRGNARRGAAPSAYPLAEALTILMRTAKSRGETAVGLRLPLDGCFARSIELPAGARKDVRQILDMDLERATPFKHRDVYTAHVVDGEDAARGRLRVRQLVTKREAVDPLVAEVKSAGLEVAYVDCWSGQPGSGLPVNFLAPRDGAGGQGGTRRAVRGLAGLALLLLASGLLLGLLRYETALAELETKTAQARQQAAAVRGVLERADSAVADLARLQDLKMKRVPAIEVLEEVTRILPDTVWLTDLRLEDDVLDISGLAPSAAALPPLFGKSALVTDAALTAPVTFDQREDKERFSLRVRVKHQALPRQAAATEKPE